MKLLRYGPPGQERPAVLVDGTTAVDVGDALAATFGRADAPFLAYDRSVRLDELADLVARRGPGTREVDLDGVRIGPPLARPGKIVCIGLNYADHARESGAQAPAEPIVFMKAPNAVVGPDDDILIPPGSTKTDWEVELGVVIGRTARYLPDERSAADVIAGYVLANDVSERHYQLERGGQWVKGKSCETFNPLGPWLVTADEVPDPQRLRLTLDLNGQSGAGRHDRRHDLRRPPPGALPEPVHGPRARGPHRHRDPGGGRDGTEAAALPGRRRRARARDRGTGAPAPDRSSGDHALSARGRRPDPRGDRAGARGGCSSR